MEFTLQIWRQRSADSEGELRTYQAKDISPDMSFLEMLDSVNIQLEEAKSDPVEYYADCLEGICGSCSMMINGIAHGPGKGITTCQLYMRSFKDGETITVEPWKIKAFPIIKDLVTDRSAFDRIMQVGGFVSVNTGNAPDGNSVPVPKEAADISMDAAQCIGCGACAAACKNGSAMLFVAAKVGHLAHLPQGQAERYRRVKSMVEQMDEEGFGNCTNQYECEAVCPKEITASFITKLNREYLRANLCSGK